MINFEEDQANVLQKTENIIPLQLIYTRKEK